MADLKVQGRSCFVAPEFQCWPLAGLAAISAAWIYAPTLVWLVQTWIHDKPYSHGFLVPLVSGYLLWVRRRTLHEHVGRPASLVGGLTIAAALVLVVAGRLSGVRLLEGASLVLLGPGIVLVFGGWALLRAFAVPLGFLLFMVPWFDLTSGPIHGPFRLISAQLGTWIMHQWGIPVVRYGTQLQLPEVLLEVAAECSGLNFFISIAVVGIALVYLTQRTWPRAIAVIAAGLLITFLANAFRIALVGLMVRHYGVETSHGPMHVFQGWFAAQVGYVGLFLVNWAVTKLPYRAEERLFERKSRGVPAPEASWAGASGGRRLLSVSVVLLVAAVYLGVFAQPVPVPLRRPLADFTFEFGVWHCREANWLEVEKFLLGADASLVRRCSRDDGVEVRVAVAYFERQIDRKELVNYRDAPLRKESVERSFALNGSDSQRVNRSLPLLGGVQYESVFWYAFPGGSTVGRLETKLRMLTDGLLHRRNNGAVIVLAKIRTSEVGPGGISPELIAIGADLAPRMREHLYGE